MRFMKRSGDDWTRRGLVEWSIGRMAEWSIGRMAEWTYIWKSPVGRLLSSSMVTGTNTKEVYIQLSRHATTSPSARATRTASRLKPCGFLVQLLRKVVHHHLRTFFEAEISNRFSIQYFIGGGGGSSFFYLTRIFSRAGEKKSDK